jgi:hypothetical protein
MDVVWGRLGLCEFRANKGRMIQFTAVLALYIRNLTGHQYPGRYGALGRGVLGIFCRRFLGWAALAKDQSLFRFRVMGWSLSTPGCARRVGRSRRCMPPPIQERKALINCLGVTILSKTKLILEVHAK